jgi:hypothetical protein
MGENCKTDFQLKTRTLDSQCENQTKNQTENYVTQRKPPNTGKNRDFLIFWLLLNII